MRKFVGLALALILLIWVVVFVFIAPAHGNVPVAVVEPPDRFMPGSPLPDDARCMWDHYYYSGSYLFCDVPGATDAMGNPREVYLGFDHSRGVISSLSMSVGDVTVGDLIAAWGLPTGYTGYSYSVEVHWGKRSVWLYGPTFSPSSKPLYLHYSLKPEKAGPWRGFVNADR